MSARMRLRVAGLAAGLAALAACNPSGTAIDVAHAPRMKAGLWMMSGALEGEARPPTQVCSAGDISILPAQDASCSQQQAVRRPDGAIDYDAVCSKFGETMRVHRHVVGDAASAFTSDTSSVVKRPGAADVNLSSHFQYRYQGPCPPGMKVFVPTSR